jgi:hypothetical protein
MATKEEEDMPPEHHWHDWYGGPPGAPGTAFVHLIFAGLSMLFWLLLIALLFWVVSRAMEGARPMPAVQPAAAPSPLELVSHHYVVGDIDYTTFEQMVDLILAYEAEGRKPRVMLL